MFHLQNQLSIQNLQFALISMEIVGIFANKAVKEHPLWHCDQNVHV